MQRRRSPANAYRHAIEDAGLRIGKIWPYKFIFRQARTARAKCGAKSISHLVVKPDR